MISYDNIVDLDSYVAPYLEQIKISTGISEVGGTISSITILSLTTRGDAKVYLLEIEIQF
jgi:hypothetical protein